jgi:hypothetical protein
MKRMRRKILMAIVTVVAMLAAMPAASSLAAKKTRLRGNIWGSEQAIVTVTAKGATIEFECADGTIDEPLTINKDGTFDLSGTFTPRSHGPTRDDGPAQVKSRYAGRSDGNSLEFTIKLSDTTLGPFTVKRGEHPALKRCG